MRLFQDIGNTTNETQHNKGFKNVQKGYDIIKAYKKKYAEQEGNLEWLR
jgi:hypothetical protein